jgi:heme exporter protein D
MAALPLHKQRCVAPRGETFLLCNTCARHNPVKSTLSRSTTAFMNPYVPPQAPALNSRRPSVSFWLALAVVLTLLVAILLLQLLYKQKHTELRRETRENMQQLQEAIRKYEQRNNSP